MESRSSICSISRLLEKKKKKKKKKKRHFVLSPNRKVHLFPSQSLFMLTFQTYLRAANFESDFLGF